MYLLGSEWVYLGFVVEAAFLSWFNVNVTIWIDLY